MILYVGASFLQSVAPAAYILYSGETIDPNVTDVFSFVWASTALKHARVQLERIVLIWSLGRPVPVHLSIKETCCCIQFNCKTGVF